MQGQVEHDVAGGPLVVGMEQLLVHRLEQVADVEVGLEHLELRGHGMEGELGAHRRADLALHAVLPVEQGHEQRHRSHAMAEDLDRARAGDPEHLVDGSGPVQIGDVVHGELGVGRREVDARPVVEQPHVVSLVEEELDQIGMDGRREHRGRRHGEARSEHHRPLVAAAIADEPGTGIGDVSRDVPPPRRVAQKDDLVVPRAPPGPGTQGRGRRRHREAAQLVERSSVEGPDRTGEHGDEPDQVRSRVARLTFSTSACARRWWTSVRPMCMMPRARTARFVGGVAFVDRDVERGGVLPGRQDGADVDDLVAFEEEGL